MENTWLKEERTKSLGKNIEILEEDLLEIEKEMLETIDKVDEYCYKKGTIGGLRWGFDCFDKAFEGLQPGLMLVAGMPNAGNVLTNS